MAMSELQVRAIPSFLTTIERLAPECSYEKAYQEGMEFLTPLVTRAAEKVFSPYNETTRIPPAVADIRLATMNIVSQQLAGRDDGRNPAIAEAFQTLSDSVEELFVTPDKDVTVNWIGDHYVELSPETQTTVQQTTARAILGIASSNLGLWEAKPDAPESFKAFLRGESYED
ncbi:hypothetical protein MUP32_06830, partial [Candidatus Microgenomates bacterium]|nr:hypothetical protein [Candidatus Microgenomates bacterium]